MGSDGMALGGSMITAVNHYTLAVTDIDASFAFYRDVLGLKPLCKWPIGGDAVIHVKFDA